jgi:hypothetical protein
MPTNVRFKTVVQRENDTLQDNAPGHLGFARTSVAADRFHFGLGQRVSGFVKAPEILKNFGAGYAIHVHIESRRSGNGHA